MQQGVTSAPRALQRTHDADQAMRDALRLIAERDRISPAWDKAVLDVDDWRELLQRSRKAPDLDAPLDDDEESALARLVGVSDDDLHAVVAEFVDEGLLDARLWGQGTVHSPSGWHGLTAEDEARLAAEMETAETVLRSRIKRLVRDGHLDADAWRLPPVWGRRSKIGPSVSAALQHQAELDQHIIAHGLRTGPDHRPWSHAARRGAALALSAVLAFAAVAPLWVLVPDRPLATMVDGLDQLAQPLQAVAGLPFTAAAAADMVLVCHVPPGNPAQAHAILIATPAVPAHLAHGDSLGTCSTGDDGSGDDGSGDDGSGDDGSSDDSSGDGSGDDGSGGGSGNDGSDDGSGHDGSAGGSGGGPASVPDGASGGGSSIPATDAPPADVPVVQGPEAPGSETPNSLVFPVPAFAPGQTLLPLDNLGFLQGQMLRSDTTGSPAKGRAKHGSTV